MTKERYIQLKKDNGFKTYELAKAADKLIKEEALKGLRKYLASNKLPIRDQQFILEMVRYNFVSAEIDNYLIDIKAYPEWV